MRARVERSGGWEPGVGRLADDQRQRDGVCGGRRDGEAPVMSELRRSQATMAIDGRSSEESKGMSMVARTRREGELEWETKEGGDGQQGNSLGDH